MQEFPNADPFGIVTACPQNNGIQHHPLPSCSYHAHTPASAPPYFTCRLQSAPTNLPEVDWWNKSAGLFERYYVMHPAELCTTAIAARGAGSPPHASRRASSHPHAECRSRLPLPFKERGIPFIPEQGGPWGAGPLAQRPLGGFGPVPPCKGGERVPTRCGERSREPGRGAGRRTNPRCRGGSGEHSPSSSQPEPAEPRSGASIPAARPLRPAPRTAALTAHPAGPARRAPHTPRRSPGGGRCF